jgi:hypothetical protein
MRMLNEQSTVDLIERAHSARPYCACGRGTTTVYRDGAVWLDCSIVNEPVVGKIHRLWNVVSDPGHVHELIVEIPAPSLRAA